MSDSDSDDITSRITKEETNFWDVYKTKNDAQTPPTEDPLVTEFGTPRASVTMPDIRLEDDDNKNKGKANKAKKRGAAIPSTSKKSKPKRRRVISSSQSDDSENEERTSRSGNPGKPSTNTDKNSNMLSSILKTLSAPTAASSAEQQEETRESSSPSTSPGTSRNIWSSILKSLNVPATASAAGQQIPLLAPKQEPSIAFPNFALNNPPNVPSPRRTRSRTKYEHVMNNRWNSQGIDTSRSLLRTNLDISIDNVASGLDETLREEIESVAADLAIVLNRPQTQPIDVDECPATPPKKLPTFEEINPEIEVKIVWKSLYQKLFKIKRFTPLKKIVDHFVEQESIRANDIYFSFNEEIINLNVHSCVTLHYWSQDEIEGNVCADNVDMSRYFKEPHGIKLKVRLDRKWEIIRLEPNVKFECVYAQVVIKFDLNISKFKLQFDGTNIGYYQTIDELEMEDGDCIDIILL